MRFRGALLSDEVGDIDEAYVERVHAALAEVALDVFRLLVHLGGGDAAFIPPSMLDRPRAIYDVPVVAQVVLGYQDAL